MGSALQQGYDSADKDRGYVALAVCNNNAERAARLLRKQGRPIPARTLRDWRRLHPEDYHEVRTSIVERIRQDQAEEHSELGHLAMDLERKMLTRLSKEMDELEPKDLSNAHRNAAVVAGIHGQRASELRGDPSIVEYRKTDTSDPEAIATRLAEKYGVRLVIGEEVIEGSAVEVMNDEADVVADAPRSAETRQQQTPTPQPSSS